MADPNQQQGAISPSTDLYKSTTGSVGPDNKPIYDVFSGTEHIADPNDPRLKGIDIASLPERASPTDFKSSFLPFKTNVGSDIVSDSSKIKSNIDDLGNQIKQFTTNLGVTPPSDKISDVVKASLQSIQNRQAELEKRKQEDVAAAEKQFATGEEQLKLTQEQETAQAEGRTRIGGFITQMETNDLQRLSRQHAIDMANFEAQKQSTILQAKRAYEDENFKLSEELMKSVKDLEDTQYNKQQDYFNNITKSADLYSKLTKPIRDAEQSNIDQAVQMMTNAPSAFADIKPSDIALGKITYGEIVQRYLDSPEYALKIRGEEALVRRRENLAGIGGNEGGGVFTPTQINKGAANANMKVDDFSNLDQESQNYFINRGSDVKKAEKAIDTEVKAKTNYQDIIDEINSYNIPQAVKDHLINIVPKPKPSKPGILEKGWQKIKNFF